MLTPYQQRHLGHLDHAARASEARFQATMSNDIRVWAEKQKLVEKANWPQPLTKTQQLTETTYAHDPN